MILRPTEIPDSGLLFDLLWSKPNKEVSEYRKDFRYDQNKDYEYIITFGEKAMNDFIKKNDINLIVRSNQLCNNEGFEFFGDNRHLITIFSAPNFEGEYDNNSAILFIDDNLTCSLKVLRPLEKTKND